MHIRLLISILLMIFTFACAEDFDTNLENRKLESEDGIPLPSEDNIYPIPHTSEQYWGSFENSNELKEPQGFNFAYYGGIGGSTSSKDTMLKDINERGKVTICLESAAPYHNNALSDRPDISEEQYLENIMASFERSFRKWETAVRDNWAWRWKGNNWVQFDRRYGNCKDVRHGYGMKVYLYWGYGRDDRIGDCLRSCASLGEKSMWLREEAVNDRLDALVLHEMGHLLGLGDAYQEAQVDTRQVPLDQPRSVMGWYGVSELAQDDITGINSVLTFAASDVRNPTCPPHYRRGENIGRPMSELYCVPDFRNRRYYPAQPTIIPTELNKIGLNKSLNNLDTDRACHGDEGLDVYKVGKTYTYTLKVTDFLNGTFDFNGYTAIVNNEDVFEYIGKTLRTIGDNTNNGKMGEKPADPEFLTRIITFEFRAKSVGLTKLRFYNKGKEISKRTIYSSDHRRIVSLDYRNVHPELVDNLTIPHMAKGDIVRILTNNDGNSFQQRWNNHKKPDEYVGHITPYYRATTKLWEKTCDNNSYRVFNQDFNETVFVINHINDPTINYVRSVDPAFHNGGERYYIRKQIKFKNLVDRNIKVPMSMDEDSRFAMDLLAKDQWAHDCVNGNFGFSEMFGRKLGKSARNVFRISRFGMDGSGQIEYLKEIFSTENCYGDSIMVKNEQPGVMFERYETYIEDFNKFRVIMRNANNFEVGNFVFSNTELFDVTIKVAINGVEVLVPRVSRNFHMSDKTLKRVPIPKFSYGAHGASYYMIQSKWSGRCLDVEGGWKADNLLVWQWRCHLGDNQQFKLQNYYGEWDEYTLRFKHSGKALDLFAYDQSNGAIYKHYFTHGDVNQRFKLEYRGNGYYAIKNVHSGKCLDILGWSKDNFGLLGQWDCHYGDNQLFRFVPVNWDMTAFPIPYMFPSNERDVNGHIDWRVQ